jgi:hypothetical protein
MHGRACVIWADLTPFSLEDPVRYSPCFGEHCAEVLCEELGIGVAARI